MRKSIILLLFFVTGYTAVFSQSTVTSVSYNKKDQPALLLGLPYNSDVSEDFILKTLKRAGYEPETKNGLFGKNSKINGYYTFKGVNLDGVKQAVDLYFKVEQRGRKPTDQSFIYLLTSTGGESFVSSTSDKDLHKAAKKFLDDFVEQSAAFKLGLDIEEQEYAIKDEEKKMDKLKLEGKALGRKMELLQADLKKNREDQENQQKSIEVEQKKLAGLKAQKAA